MVDAKLWFHLLFVLWAWIPTIASEFHFVNLCACFYVCEFVSSNSMAAHVGEHD